MNQAAPFDSGMSSLLAMGYILILIFINGIKFDVVLVCSLQPDDTGKGLTLQGPLAGFVRRAAYLYRQPTDQHKLRVGRDWLQQAAEEAQRMLSGSRVTRSGR